MPNKVFTGAISTDAAVAGNYDPSGVPVNGDVIFFNDETQRDFLLNLSGATWTGKKVGAIIEKGFTRTIGGSGNAWAPEGFNLIVFEGSVQTTSYFAAAATFKADEVFINTQTQFAQAVNLGGQIDYVTVRQGHAVCDAAVDINVSAAVKGSGQGTSKLVIPSAATLTGAKLTCENGHMECNADIATVDVGPGGEFLLAGGADISSRVDISDGGTLLWEAAGASGAESTIALAMCWGGMFKTQKARIGRILTACSMFGNAQVDFEVGGLGMTLPTGGIRVFGNNRPKGPKGATHIIGV